MKRIAMICLLALCASTVCAGGFWANCVRTSTAGGWAEYSAPEGCSTIWVGWGSNGADRCRWYNASEIPHRDQYLTYRHGFNLRANGDTNALHWSYAEGSYSGNQTFNQKGAGGWTEPTINARASYNWDDWMEVGSDWGGGMDTVCNVARLYPELDAIYKAKSVEPNMYMGNVYKWIYDMENPWYAWWTWNTAADQFYHIGGVVSGPGWYSSGAVVSAPGTAPEGVMYCHFNMRPTQTGTSNEDFQMIRNGTSWFGDKPASNSDMRTAVTVTRKNPSATAGWDSGAKKKGETVRFSVYGADSWGAGDNYSWDFDHNTTQGWYAGNNTTITKESGQIKIGITGADPFVYSFGGLAINTNQCKYVSIRMNANGGSTAQFFWKGTAGDWSSARQVDFDIYSDSKWHIYTIPLPASWTGTVTQFRFDPVQTGAANGQTVYVDWIRIHNVNAGMSAKAWLGKANNSWTIWSEQAATWDGTNVCWYKDYIIPDGYPQTYYHVMHVYNNANQTEGEDPDRRYAQYQRAYKVLNTAPSATNNSYPSNGWCTTKTPALGWNYTDTDSNAQSRYQVQVSTAANFSNIVADTDLVASNANSCTAPSLPEGQLYYRTRVMDGAYANVNATYQGGCLLNQNGALSGDPNSKSVDFNGTNGYVNLPSGFDSFGSGFTCEFWAYPTAANSWARFLDMGNGAPMDNIIIARRSTSDDLIFSVRRGDAVEMSVKAENVISLNTWQHFVLTLDTSGYGRIYKNGSLVAQGPMQMPEVVNLTKCYIGKSNWDADAYYKGRLGEFAIYDRCLPAAEVSSHYSKASQSDSAYRDAVCANSPWVYYRFDEVSGTTASAYTGMLSNWSAGTNFRVDSIAPTQPSITGIDLSSCTTASVSFGGSVDDNAVTYEVKLDNGAFEAKTSPAVFSSLANGPHMVYVRAIDEAGNISEVASQPFDNSAPAAPTNASANARCGSGIVEFSVTSDSGCTVKWYDAATGGNVVSTANPYSESLTATTTYYAASVSPSGCESATRLAVTGTISDLPAAPTNASNNSRCGAGDVEFSVTPAEGFDVKWYDAPTGGNVVSTANPFTETLSATTTYYAASVSDECESATRTAVTGTVFVIPAAPTNASANVRCGSGEIEFSVAVESGCSVKWYDAEVGGNAISTANPYSEEIDATTTYYASTVSADGCESEERLAVTGTVNEIPAAPTNASANAICGLGIVGFSVTPAAGCSVIWYDAAIGGNVVSTANPYNPTLSITTTYYAASVSDKGCESTARLAVTGTVNAIPAAPTNASANARCGSGDVDFSVTPAANCTVKWYDAATGGTVVSTANPYTEDLSAAKTYYAASVSAAGCESATRLAVTGTVNEIPATPTNASSNSRCGAGQVAFSVDAASGCTVKWYSAATGGTLLSTANPYTVSLSNTTTYYATSVSAAGCESATRTAVTGTVNAIPAAPADASSNDRCGSGAIDFEVSVDNGCSVRWYDAASGGNVISTANPYTAELTETTTLYAAAVSAAGCESTTRLAVTSTVNPLPAAPSDASNNARCGTGAVAFEVTADTGCTVRWYAAATGGVPVSIANPYSANLSETTTLYAASVSPAGCESATRTAVTGAINIVPGAPTNASSNERYGEGNVDFSVTAAGNCTIAWYDAQTGGNLVSTANPYTAELTETTTLYAANVSAEGCESARTAVTGTVNEMPDPPTISIGSPSASLTKSGPITFEITYGDATDVTLSEDDITLNTTGTATGAIQVSGDGLTTRTVTISDITGDGTIGISIAEGTAVGLADLEAPPAGPSDTFMVDNTAPTTEAAPVGGVYSAAQNVTLTADDASAIYYTVDGSLPTTESTLYTGAVSISADATLKFFAVDEAGNAESIKQEIYAILDDEGSILAARQAEVGAPIKLGNKTLYFKGDGFGYIEEANRIQGIRIEGAIAAGEDSIVSLTGTRGVTSEGEPCITVSQLTAAGEGTVAPWGTNGKSFQFDLLDGLCVKTWGQVKWGSIDGNSYVVTTGSADTEIKVITKSAPTVSEGDFVIVTGAVGFGNIRVIYAK